jgi:hypothetical protein
MKRVLITGSGTGFGQEVAMRLAEKGFDVVAAVEIYAQVQTLKRQAAARNVTLQVDPGPFLTGFNDRGFETWRSWEDDASQRLFDYSKLAFPRAQFDPEPVYATLTAVAAGEVDSYRNLEPKSMLDETKQLIDAPWTKKVRDGLGTRPASLQKSYEMKPETPVAE